VHCLCLGARGVQVPLMDVLGSAVGALDAHRGVAGVASNGLWFLAALAIASENKVSATRGFSCCSDVGLVVAWVCALWRRCEVCIVCVWVRVVCRCR
jgi:hypothetical protein